MGSLFILAMIVTSVSCYFSQCIGGLHRRTSDTKTHGFSNRIVQTKKYLIVAETLYLRFRFRLLAVAFAAIAVANAAIWRHFALPFAFAFAFAFAVSLSLALAL